MFFVSNEGTHSREITEPQIHDAVRIAATVQATAVALAMAEAPPMVAAAAG